MVFQISAEIKNEKNCGWCDGLHVLIKLRYIWVHIFKTFCIPIDVECCFTRESYFEVQMSYFMDDNYRTVVDIGHHIKSVGIVRRLMKVLLI